MRTDGKDGLLIVERESTSERLTAVFNIEQAQRFSCAGEILYEQNYDGKMLNQNGVLVFKEKKV